MLAVLVLLCCFFAAQARLFTISGPELERAAVSSGARFMDTGRSFDIVPAGYAADKGIIFYPGALVDSRAYAPELSVASSALDTRVFIVKPHARLAEFDRNAAKAVMAAHPEIRDWYIGGHSMGGGAACGFANANPSQVKGLFLFAAYCPKSSHPYGGPAVVLTGTNDKLEPPAKIRGRVPKQAKIVTVKGANHASFGDYGSQPFDGPRNISESARNAAVTEALRQLIRQ